MSDTNGFGDYQLQLRDGAVEEDWSTVNKKSKAKAASKQEAASDSALQGSTSGTAPVKAPELDPDGWEMAPNLVLPNISKQPSEDNSWNTVNKKDRKAKALSQNAQAASDDARNSKAPDGWDGDADEEFEDAASSLSDPFGSSKAPSTSRPGSAVDRQPSKQNDRQQSRQSLKSPSKQLGASGSDVQCHKCGVYGHMAANCDDKYCDYCEKPGHQIAQCDRHKEFLSKQNQMPAKQHQAFVKDNQRGARQDQQPFRQGQGPGNSDRESGHPNVPYYPNTCFGCGQYGHKKINCPHPPPGRRSMHQNQNIAPLSSQQPPPPPRQHDPRAAAQSVTTTDADVQKPTPEQVQGRGRGPEPDTEAPQPRKVVPVKPTRYATAFISQ